MCLEYHEVCWEIKTSDIIEDMKIKPRNKRIKAEIVDLDTSIYRDLMMDLDIVVTPHIFQGGHKTTLPCQKIYIYTWN